MKELSISEVTKITGLSRTTLLYYESKGLLTPRQTSETGYRKYTMDDISQILFYQSVKPLGISVEEYVAASDEVVENDPSSDIYELILLKKSEYLRRISAYISMWEETMTFSHNLRKQGFYCGFQMSKDAWMIPLDRATPDLLREWGQYFIQRNLSYFFHGGTYTRGLSCYADCAKPLSYELRSKLTWLPGKPSLLLAEQIDLQKENFTEIFQKAFDVLKKQDLDMGGDPWGNVGYREIRGNRSYDYFFLWIPVRPAGKEAKYETMEWWQKICTNQ